MVKTQMAKCLEAPWLFIETWFVHVLAVCCFGITLVIVIPVELHWWYPHFFSMYNRFVKYIRVIEFLRIFEFHNLRSMRGGLMFPDSTSEEKLKKLIEKMEDLQARSLWCRLL